MAKFNADLTNPPGIDSNKPVDTGKDWFGYVLISGLAFVALGVASNVVAPAVGNLLSMAGLSSGEETGVTISGEL